MEALRMAKFASTDFELAYIPLISDGHIQFTMNKISSAFRLQMPIAYRRANIHKRIFDIGKMAKNGGISGMMAFRKCCMMAGDDVASREATLFITVAYRDLHHALAESWGMKADPKVPAGEPLSDDVLCTGIRDYFHVSRLHHTKK